jgi:uridine phosphorylase
MAVSDGGVPPITTQKHYPPLSVFTPENLPREARRRLL